MRTLVFSRRQRNLVEAREFFDDDDREESARVIDERRPVAGWPPLQSPVKAQYSETGISEVCVRTAYNVRS